ncbi:uncharacterized protein MICPUCDRAFT_53205 [Micromonas pusilla CCMP1545]|jgi:transmembrane protein 17|uniref:Predicted protein n=1 Tax=Micromonas pusilla (strain CCMP1545) TaxID=564608 RepID=C1N696_MICPC|nr:uncharacterized protein MICPUCDRAFT_53205 [Micromonas pusilla CCMP1545]EEH52630.1 predicted protein [Micromonas pusilla CCMP1545]|tara:strand:+ start:403 stop:966 length:564 start_codon:yes stop_codon:yes gene_type:complete|eukprot:XP_003063494.1 predicted protein [Micromonas pusilla CCMP1545]
MSQRPTFHYDAGARSRDRDVAFNDVAAGAASPHAPVRMAHRAVASDVYTQMLIHYNAYFALAWWIATVTSTLFKTKGSATDDDDVRPVMIAMFMIFEPCRLYCGYAGNLQEKIPLMAGFVLLSFFVVLPLHAYFWWGQDDASPFDKSLNNFACVLIFLECITGVNAARKTLAAQSLAFYMSGGVDGR